MGKIDLFLITLITWLTSGLASYGGNKGTINDSSFLIGEECAGYVCFNSTIKQLEKKFKYVKVEKIDDDSEYEPYIYVELSNSSEPEIRLTVYYVGYYSDDNKPFYDVTQCYIESIGVLSSKYRTENSIYVGQTYEEIMELEIVYYSTADPYTHKVRYWIVEEYDKTSRHGYFDDDNALIDRITLFRKEDEKIIMATSTFLSGDGTD
jgi:hypothetical protein